MGRRATLIVMTVAGLAWAGAVAPATAQITLPPLFPAPPPAPPPAPAPTPAPPPPPAQPLRQASYGGGAVGVGMRMFRPGDARMTFRTLDRRRASMRATLYGRCGVADVHRRIALSSDGSFALRATVRDRLPGGARRTAVIAMAGRLTGRTGAGTASAALTFRHAGRTVRCKTPEIAWQVYAAQPGASAGQFASPLPGRAYVGLTAQANTGSPGRQRMMLLHTDAAGTRVQRTIFEYRNTCLRFRTIEMNDTSPGGAIAADGRFSRTTRFTIAYSDGYRERFVVRVSGRFVADGIRGSVNVRTSVRRNSGGPVLERCGTANVRFHAVSP